MLIEEGINAFLADHRVRGSRPKTIWWYETTLKRLLKAHMDVGVDTITQKDLPMLINAPKASQSTLANYDRALRGFFNWLAGIGEIETSPFKGRKCPRESFKLRDVLTVDEIVAMFRACDDDKRFKYRHRALLYLFIDCGLRASEVARLNIVDVDWESSTLRITGKTGYASIPMSRRTVQTLRLYVSRERKTNAPHLFVFNGKPLNQNSLSHLVSRIAKRAGIARPVGTHLLRHTFATHFLRNGGDAFTLQRLMRHGSMNMTMRYVNFVTGDLQGKAEKYSPLNNLKV